MPTTLGSSFLQSTLGALLIGILLSCILFGILTLQTYLYYTKFPEDRVQLKTIVRSRSAYTLPRTLTSVLPGGFYMVTSLHFLWDDFLDRLTELYTGSWN